QIAGSSLGRSVPLCRASLLTAGSLSCRRWRGRRMLGVQALFRHQPYKPLDEDPYLVAQMPVRRIDDVKWHWLDTPVRQNGNEPPAGDVISDHAARKLARTEAGKNRRRVTACVIDG